MARLPSPTTRRRRSRRQTAQGRRRCHHALPDGKITSAEKENEDGKVVYDIELTSAALKYEMTSSRTETIEEIEKEIKRCRRS